ncbi:MULTISPECIES: DUF1876 domain-containing protein [unclassified Kitasatospora]|uniref:DUF1876 domain-containing protein n=1 Tax=unclassified Kitasatospora TaxID=2633591 RepID=UPI0007094384|nr:MULTISPECIES: DUF1876 domain-containing protein [unclassified Kitasatospora]KQV21885.1 hypothetical protein ASC99_19270 [Kitasatospora sp. Root107]KRB75693.1 hypothetical protein ASE03_15485 [Kitasatospora sp. Root187]
MTRTLVGWHVELEFAEEGDRTKAAALVRLADGTELRAHGFSTRHHDDRPQLRVGEEVAGARALNELAMLLLTKAHDELREGSRPTDYAIS